MLACSAAQINVLVGPQGFTDGCPEVQEVMLVGF